jgi:hypothetical protein
VKRMARPHLAATALAAAILAHAQPVHAQPAGPALLAQAQAALDDLHYEDAAALLDRAWRAGDNRPDDLILLFRLAGQVAVTLGKDADAELAFRRLLLLAPDAALPDGTSPKIAARLDAARAATRQPLAVTISERPVAAGQRAIDITIVSDPLKMIAGARIAYRDAGGVERTRELRGLGAINLPLSAGVEVRVDLLDEHGNTLRVETLTTAPEPSRPAPRPAPPPAPVSLAPPAEDSPPIHARGITWAAAAAGLGAAGLFFGLRSESAQDELDQLNRSSADHDFRDALAVEDRLRRDSLIANIGFAASGAAAAVAVVLWLRERRRDRPPSHAIRPISGTAWTLDWSFAF